MYNVKYEHRVSKDLKDLPKDIIKQALNKIETILKSNPLAGEKLEYRGIQLYKYRIRDYRIIYTINTGRKEIIVIRIRHRKGVYRRL